MAKIEIYNDNRDFIGGFSTDDYKITPDSSGDYERMEMHNRIDNLIKHASLRTPSPNCCRILDVERAYEAHGYSTEGRDLLTMVNDQLDATEALHDIIKELRTDTQRLNK